MTEQQCRSCGIVKPLDGFGKYTKTNGRVQWRLECKSCRSAAECAKYHGSDKIRADARTRSKRSHLKRMYGITPEELAVMEARQEHKCLICNETPDKLHVDHCHTNGHVRGLLCGTCNRGVGMFKDDVQMLQSAIKYLQGDIDGS